MATFEADYYFDSEKCTQHINGKKIAFHCNHYSRLYTQLACDANELFSGKQLLADSAEEVFYSLLTSYESEHPEIMTPEHREAIAKQYFAFSGMGMMEGDFDSAEVSLVYSHIDEAWKKEWGENDTPVNFIAKGYLAAAFAFVYQTPPHSFVAEELSGIVQGAEKSIFSIKKCS